MKNKIIFKFIYYSSTLFLRIASEISLFFSLVFLLLSQAAVIGMKDLE